MPLTLNLLHEEQKLLKERKRDPLKLGIYCLVGVALLFVFYYVYRLADDSSLTAQLRAKQAEWRKLAPQATEAEAQAVTLNKTISGAAAVTQRIENRFYWAPLLDLLLKATPPNIQLTSFGGENDMRNEAIAFNVTGLAAGAKPEPRAAAESYRTSLIDALRKANYPDVSASFRDLVEAPGTVDLGGKPLPTATFTLDIKMKKPKVVAAAESAPAEAYKPRRR